MLACLKHHLCGLASRELEGKAVGDIVHGKDIVGAAGGVGDQEHSAGTVEVAGRTAADLPARNDVKTCT